MARNIYPGVFRKKFGFENWKDFDPELLQEIYDDDTQERAFDHKIYGYDLNLRAIEAADANVKAAGVGDIVALEQRDFQKFEQPAEKAIMVTNPPYGERLKPEDLTGLYQMIGKTLKHSFCGNEAWIISYKEECFEAIGLKPSFKIPLYNGALDCEFRKYQLFDGKLNAFRAAGGEVKTVEERRRMGEKHRFKQNRGEFNRRPADEERVPDEDFTPEYEMLRKRHREFQNTFGPRERRNDNPRRFEGEKDFKRGKGGDFKHERGDFKRRGDRDERGRGGKFGGRSSDRRDFGGKRGGKRPDRD